MEEGLAPPPRLLSTPIMAHGRREHHLPPCDASKHAGGTHSDCPDSHRELGIDRTPWPTLGQLPACRDSDQPLLT
eukprot:scaffold22078_cov33-Tisochrysis_lutea.AAC.4